MNGRVRSAVVTFGAASRDSSGFRSGRAWRVAVPVAVGVHAALLALVLTLGLPLGASYGDASFLLRLQRALLAEPIATSANMLVDVTWIDVDETWEDVPTVPSDPVPALLRADDTRRVSEPRSPGLGVLHSALPPAPDVGSAIGTRPEDAWRRDRSQLRVSTANGADANQLSRDASGRSAASPQPERREPRSGVGDSARTRTVTQGLPGADLAAADPDGIAPTPGIPGAREGTSAETQQSQGPADGDLGPRRYDVDEQGPARETVSVRAASSETDPGLMDLSQPSSVGQGESKGRGASDRPGAVARPSVGVAPVVTGTPLLTGAAQGPPALSTDEWGFDRDRQTIRARAAQSVRFPQRLALLLEQGESIVRFVVRTDGRVDGPIDVVRSAGLLEFDSEAVSAVRRAAPFPPMKRALRVSMRFQFRNPVVR